MPIIASGVPVGLMRPACRVTSFFFEEAGTASFQQPFATSGGPLVVQFACSATAPGARPGNRVLIAVDLQLDGVAILTSKLWSEDPTRKALVPVTLVHYSVPAGNHTFTQAPQTGTYVDGLDHFSITVTEFGLPVL